MNKTLMTDFYELTMAETYYFDGEKDKQVQFDLFFRTNPFGSGYTISGGLDETIKYIQNFHFDEEDIEYLRSLKTFKEEFLEYLKNLKFKGNIYAVPDGTVVFPNEPVLTVQADIITAQILETALLANFNHHSLVTTKAKRITKEAEKIPVMEFGARRARGIDSAIEASKCAYIGGCVGTSNTLASKLYKIPPLGTMAHSLIMDKESEEDAFLSYAKTNPYNTVFLVDTYDTLRSGIPSAIKVANEYLTPNGYPFKGIRIDSGDLAYLSKKAREMLDQAGYKDTQICLSNGLDEYTIRDLLLQGAVIDSIGCGDNIVASKERVNGVYKLVGVEKNGIFLPKIKVSNDKAKTINPGIKKVTRFYDKDTGFAKGDLVSLKEENIASDTYTLVDSLDITKRTTLTNYQTKELLVPIFINGNLVYKKPTINETRDYCEKEYNTMYPEVTRILNPHNYYVDLSENLRKLKERLILEHKENLGRILKK